ncbi:hypothetical protein CPARA_2gp222 (nucleomorph) [Cryptomonas paramecium]|uniref:Uncharacterized protein n=1 Tax=Cryptomonas paramaecium TaxID=2898 RepID=F2HHT4_9CRYP|nr:hypothetical protein CPARA_2gp222 [Cryptomonas paramecium]AEA38880.1 hypothetical protein CPARA_2gp222 [Cryptomonas paramecium]|mmetsp:Transcript_88800/g.236397  ORF Transcript_88800/g.236397 Transcript_88800/m.236397 type:complete len:304 (+) Transcript_88800:2720-3631(+)
MTRICLGFTNGILKIFDFKTTKYTACINFRLCFGVIKPLIKFDEKHMLVGLENKFVGIFNIKSRKETRIKYSEELFTNIFTIPSQKNFIFITDENFFYAWKKSFGNWNLDYKVFSQFKIKYSSHIPKSNLFITSDGKDCLNIWSIFKDSLFFSGKIKIKENISKIESSLHEKCFLVQTKKNFMHIYTNHGILVHILSEPMCSKFSNHSFFQNSIKFYNKNILLTGGTSRNISLWDLRVKKIVRQWKGHIGSIEQIDIKNFHHENTSFISYDTSNVVKLWDIRQECETKSFKIHNNRISFLKSF